jgi:hypothetical protein
MNGPAEAGKPASTPLQKVIALMDAQSQAKSVCMKAHAGAVYQAIFAGDAVAALRAAKMSVSPWNHMPRDQIVFECFTNFATNSSGIYVDRRGHRTKSPTLAEAVACHQTAYVECGSSEVVPQANP